MPNSANAKGRWLERLKTFLLITFQLSTFIHYQTLKLTIHRGTKLKLFIEDTELVTAHYKENFFSPEGDALPHYNFVGHLALSFYPTGEPVIISILLAGPPLLGICRTKQGDTTFNIDIDPKKLLILNSKRLLKILQDSSRELAETKLVPCKDTKLISELLEYEKTEKNQFKKISQHKIGVIYVGEGQTTEEEVFRNSKLPFYTHHTHS